MRAHAAAGPAVHRGAITVFVPRGHPMHRAPSRGPGVRAWGLGQAPSRTVLAAAAAVLACAAVLAAAGLLAGVRGPASSGVAFPWLATAGAQRVGAAPARPMIVPPALSPAKLPLLASPTLALPGPLAVRVPYRGR